MALRRKNQPVHSFDHFLERSIFRYLIGSEGGITELIVSDSSAVVLGMSRFV
jgi:hypothetical protein